jgi:hypothetical protein
VKKDNFLGKRGEEEEEEKKREEGGRGWGCLARCL